MTTKQKAIVTTSWDDGHPADLRLAEMLSRHNLPATFYVPVIGPDGKPTLQSNGIRSLRRAGFEIGAHTICHTILTGIPQTRVRTEVFDSKAVLEDTLGEPITMFCYPKGRFDRHTVACLREAGYRGARTTRVLATPRNFHRYEMPTTIQAFPTRPMGYIRNLTRRMAFGSLYSYCTRHCRQKSWVDLGKQLFDTVRQRGGIWHLYGHSWELESLHLWDDLNDLFTYIAHREGILYTSNSGLLDFAHPS
ncbi:MAG TPA: polysaccharide deacetylase family protein [Bryobacteraceae bacterium]|jgi:peptidoglycan/xylan/chitin deacetylase (PgdA/CDA1 family)|nr:polysaccharide deacetylase family protein [Bryobacteraceae bacterium]